MSPLRAVMAYARDLHGSQAAAARAHGYTPDAWRMMANRDRAGWHRVLSLLIDLDNQGHSLSVTLTTEGAVVRRIERQQ